MFTCREELLDISVRRKLSTTGWIILQKASKNTNSTISVIKVLSAALRRALLKRGWEQLSFLIFSSFCHSRSSFSVKYWVLSSSKEEKSVASSGRLFPVSMILDRKPNVSLLKIVVLPSGASAASFSYKELEVLQPIFGFFLCVWPCSLPSLYCHCLNFCGYRCFCCCCVHFLLLFILFPSLQVVKLLLNHQNIVKSCKLKQRVWWVIIFKGWIRSHN